MGGSERSAERLRSTRCALRRLGTLAGVVWVCAAVALGCGASSSAKKGATGPEPSADDAGEGEGGNPESVAPTDSADVDAGGSTAAMPDFGDSPGDPEAGAGDSGATAGAGNGQKPESPSSDPRKDRFRTKVPPDKMSEFLVGPAADAMKKRQWAKAVALYQALVVARGDASPEALQLATAWTLLGQNDDAIGVLDRFISASNDPAAIRKAKAERDRLADAKNPFETQFKPYRATREASEAFKKGRKAAKDKANADALLYFRMGYALDPDLPGFLRELGYTYDRLGAKAEKIAFFQQYLLARPFGKNAEEVRKAMKNEKGALGKLTIESPLPCDEVWVNRQFIGSSKKLPMKDLLAAPGRYLGLCVNAEYSIGIWEDAEVVAGKSSSLAFKWAILANQLTNPNGRISIENYRTGRLYPLRIGQPWVGVAVPPDGRALRMKLEALNGQKRVERYIKLQPGAREVIKW